LLQIGDEYNVPVKQFYVESEEEIDKITGATAGSIVLVLTQEEGLKIKMLHSSGEWIEI
jgi:hypothetical protein